MTKMLSVELADFVVSLDYDLLPAEVPRLYTLFFQSSATILTPAPLTL
jgi:hypothetical protein